MDMEQRASRKVMLFSLYVMMVFTLANTMGQALVLDIGLSARLTISAGVSTLMLVVLLYSWAWFFLGSFVMVAGITINHLFPSLRVAIYEGISGFLINLILHFQGREVIYPENTLAFWLILVGGLSLLSSYVILRKTVVWPLMLVYCISFLGYWYSHIDLAYPMLVMFLILYLILYSLKKYQQAEKHWSAENAEMQQDLYTPWQKTAVFYGVVIVLVAALLPKSDAFFEWRWLDSKLINQFPVMMELRGNIENSRGFGTGEYFRFSSTGFQENPQVLGGPVQLSDRLVMTIEAPKPVYLRGNVKSYYQHNTWGRHQANERIHHFHQPLSTGNHEVTNGEEITLHIIYNNFSSATVFTPYMPISIDSERYQKVTVDDNYQLVFERGVFKNESYTVHALMPTHEQVDGLEPVGLLPADYLQLPDSIHPSTAQLTASITQGLIDDYGKAIALQDYLRHNHTYSLEVSQTPPGREFVEHFLFDTREGYCTYFATALAVMLRLEGIPSRYIEGYMMPRESLDGIYEVRQKNAHAWVEAYFQELGWVTLEPTPAYAIPEGQPGFGAAGFTENMPGEFDEFLLLLKSMEEPNDNLQTGEPFTSESTASDGEDAGDIPHVTITAQRLNRMVLGLSVTALLVLVLRIIWVKQRFRSYQQQLKSLTTNRQAIQLYGNIVELLTTLGFAPEGGETPYEFSKRIARQLYDMEHRFEKITNTYVLAQYSQVDLPAEATHLLCEYLQYIDQRNRHKMGVFAYVNAKYLRNDYYSIHIHTNGHRA